MYLHIKIFLQSTNKIPLCKQQTWGNPGTQSHGSITQDSRVAEKRAHIKSHNDALLAVSSWAFFVLVGSNYNQEVSHVF